MYARNVAVRLKPNTLSDFTKTFETNVLPILGRQKGFQDEITFAMPGGTDVIAISLWDTKENAEAYNNSGYPEVLKSLERFLDGSPKLRVSDVISSTLHNAAVGVARASWRTVGGRLGTYPRISPGLFLHAEKMPSSI